MMFEQPDPSLPAARIELQIAELKREHAMRIKVYPRMISNGGLRKAEAQQQMHCLLSAIRSLEFLRDNRDVIHAAIAEQREIERNIAGEVAA